MAQGDGVEQPEHEHDYGALADLARQLVQVMREGGLGSLDLRQGDLRVSLRAQQEQVVQAVAPQPGIAQAPEPAVAPQPEDATFLITSPMIGTFYTAPGPGERPFVEPGQRVEAGETVAIIEAMKIMNEIVAEKGGVVVEILVENGDAVEYGHPLMRLSEA